MLNSFNNSFSEKLLQFDAQPIGDLIADIINKEVLVLGGAFYILLQIAITGIIVGAITIVTLSIAMRTPIRPYLVELFGFDTVSSYSEYKKIKRIKQLNHR